VRHGDCDTKVLNVIWRDYRGGRWDKLLRLMNVCIRASGANMLVSVSQVDHFGGFDDVISDWAAQWEERARASTLEHKMGRTKP